MNNKIILINKSIYLETTIEKYLELFTSSKNYIIIETPQKNKEYKIDILNGNLYYNNEMLTQFTDELRNFFSTYLVDLSMGFDNIWNEDVDRSDFLSVFTNITYLYYDEDFFQSYPAQNIVEELEIAFDGMHKDELLEYIIEYNLVDTLEY